MSRVTDGLEVVSPEACCDCPLAEPLDPAGIMATSSGWPWACGHPGGGSLVDSTQPMPQDHRAPGCPLDQGRSVILTTIEEV